MSTKNLSELQTLKLRSFPRESFEELMGECEQAIIEQRAANGEHPPIFDDTMFAEIRDGWPVNDLVSSFDARLSAWVRDEILSPEEIQTILEMIDDAPWSGAVPLAQTVQGK